MRMGGFGWGDRQVLNSFTQDPSLGVDIVLLMGERKKTLGELLSTKERDLPECSIQQFHNSTVLIG